MKHLKKSSGFTLVELAIVLVIIGLIIGGILVGREMINGAAIRAQITQIEKVNAATNTFKLKYTQLAGDLTTATLTQFGFTGGGCSSPPIERCNNGFVDGVATNSLGNWYFFRNLKQANLFECEECTANYAFTAASYDALMPRAKLGNNNRIHVYGGPFPANLAGVTPPQENLSRNYIEIAESFTISNLTDPTRALTPSQAFEIDTKIDDGFPYTGTVIARGSPNSWYSGNYWRTNYAPTSGGAGTGVCINSTTTPNSYDTRTTSYRCNIRIQASF